MTGKDISEVANFPVWKTVKLGIHRSITAIRRDFQFVYSIGDRAGDMLRQIPISKEKQELDLVLVTNTGLGRPHGCEYLETVRLGEGRGLGKCPAEVGPQLRLAYHDQPYGEWLCIAMDPIAVSIDVSSGIRDLRVFGVANQGNPDRAFNSGKFLNARNANPGYIHRGDSLFVFLRPRQGR